LCRAKRIFVCPLDWGLGHATRCIPIIRQLSCAGHHVFIGASGPTLVLLQSEFPMLDFIDFPGYGITYPRSGRIFLHLSLNIHRILKCIYREHKLLAELIQKYNFDKVISDNRFGLWNRYVYSIFITHQIMIKCPTGLKFMEPLLYMINKRYIRRFDECWIPDVSGEDNISGDLSHKYPLPENAQFVGWLSRFNDPINLAISPGNINRPEWLAIISGPEPQRSIFENTLIDAFTNSHNQVCIIRGTPGHEYSAYLPDNINILDHASQVKMYNLMNSARYIICRPGYSTLMDLMALKKNAVFVPTPGQTEQEYLADYLSGKGLFCSCRQNNFEIKDIMNGYKYLPGFQEGIPSGFNFSLSAGF
jgi:hypothetical protein